MDNIQVVIKPCYKHNYPRFKNIIRTVEPCSCGCGMERDIATDYWFESYETVPLSSLSEKQKLKLRIGTKK